ncbi:ROK family protein [Citricoccus sp.]|uniref:ROK family protein n=1 Tax=Citricoccus sp. TaxID=1978372 RepID=UPI0028BDA4DE|nr:ROK family protein [Citricoccus sp.]
MADVARAGAAPVAAAIGLDVGGGAVKAGTVVLTADGTLTGTAVTGTALDGAVLPEGADSAVQASEIRIEHQVEADGDALSAVCAAIARDQYGGLRSRWPGLPVVWGVSAAAWIDPRSGRSVFSPHLGGWRDRALPQDLSRALSNLTGLPVAPGASSGHAPGAVPVPSVITDADAAAWAEARLVPPAAGPDRMVLVAIGTGIGGALVRKGAVDIGEHGMAGEFGHMTMDPAGPPCPCGNTGCWELLVSADALAARAGRASARATIDDALAGDPICLDAVAGTGRWLGRGLATLAAVLDPGRFVIGGGVSTAGELLLAPAREELARHVPGGRRRPLPSVSVATWGNRSGWVGAAGVALERAGWPVRSLATGPGPSPVE